MNLTISAHRGIWRNLSIQKKIQLTLQHEHSNKFYMDLLIKIAKFSMRRNLSKRLYYNDLLFVFSLSVSSVWVVLPFIALQK